MNTLATMPAWLALPVAVLVMLGATVTLIGAFGLLRSGHFYDRLHPPTLGTSGGAASIILSSILIASYVQGRPIIHEVVVGFGMFVTVPVTLMLLSRAALHRDRAEGARMPDLLRVGPDGRIERASHDPETDPAEEKASAPA